MSEVTDKPNISSSERKQLIIADYKGSRGTAKELAAKYGMSESGVRSILQRAGVKKGEDAERLAEAEVRAEEDAVKENAKRRVAGATSIHDRSMSVLSGLTELARKITVESVKDIDNLARKKHHINAFAKLSASVRSNLESMRVSAGLDKQVDEDEELPGIELIEMTDEHVKELRDHQEEVDRLMGGAPEEEQE